MPDSKKRKRLRSHSHDQHKRSRRIDNQLQELRDQILNLTNTVRQLVHGTEQTSLSASEPSDILSPPKNDEEKPDGK